MIYRPVFIALPLWAMSAPLYAQSTTVRDCTTFVIEDASGTDCEIIVAGNLNDPASDQVDGIISLSTELVAGQRLEAILSQISSLQQFRRSDARSANPTSQGITMRGLGGNASSRTLLFLDGVPQADPFGGWVSWPGYDAVRLSDVRVRRGGGVAEGPGGIAGTVELLSDTGIIAVRGGDFADSDYVDGALATSSRADFLARGSARQKIDAGTIGVSGSYARGDGFVPVIASQRGSVDRKAAYEQAGVAVRGVAPLSPSTELQASVRGFFDNRDRGVDFSNNSNSGVDASLRLVKREGDWKYSVTAYAQLRDLASEFGAISFDRLTVTPTLDQFATPSNGLGLRFEVRPPLDDKVELRLGGEWRRTNGETREFFTYVAGSPTRFRTAGGQNDNYGLFADATYQAAEGLSFSAGGRIDRWQIKDGFRREVNIGGAVRSDDRFVNRSGTEATGRVGMGYSLSDSWRARASAYAGWRLPTLNELYRPFRVGADATAANEALSPERIKGAEASLSFGEDRDIGVDLTFFYNRLDNAIANVALGQGPGLFPGVGFVAAGGVFRQRQNLDAIVSKGVEFDGRFEFTDWVGLRASYAFVDAHVKGAGASLLLDGLRPAQVPKHFGSASLEYGDDLRKWHAALTLRYVGGQFEDDGNSRRLRDALVADALIRHRFDNGLSIELRGENLLNTEVQAAISGAGIVERATPRTLWLGLRYKFD